ncbi:PREDICTED: vacuolar protein sorting-associated protein 72 homolog [Thamnophis sirtalis]|uniref:Vacuolar protein sorting-associated protein 72 homolog n=1 Tax=Thamnophis sirtalis TaxID=35019 RepID=A0A6I9XY95_9SAUR|nr:PREDICTED: vacuolar protein sorting-associated protein 72 homolog [Thamnophis sirtalis]
MAAAGAACSSASASSSGLAGGRAPRRTAGNRLSGLLEAEEDEFYQTTYGGFTEESGDDEYKGDQSDSEDEVDSDFDIDEGDDPSSDQDDSVPKRKRRVVTKAYKEPIKSLRLKKPDVPVSSSQKTREERSAPTELEDTVDSRKYMRQSTTEHTRQTFLRLQERQVQSRRKKGGGPSYDRPLTQEELLREAKITEELNLRSLGGSAALNEGPVPKGFDSASPNVFHGMSVGRCDEESCWSPESNGAEIFWNASVLACVSDSIRV